ncbi:hypothetical protein GDO81_012515 [Engystomops pustulosus]|uniref:Uncharacterized protein n=1 Tax=Engystomops pustulosus TaxID=76066 RepID=A0AAV7BN04_ENGPU|nr:hypothetical protein GDO81_012515 [Engystomops pustulosus]
MDTSHEQKPVDGLFDTFFLSHVFCASTPSSELQERRVYVCSRWRRHMKKDVDMSSTSLGLGQLLWRGSVTLLSFAGAACSPSLPPYKLIALRKKRKKKSQACSLLPPPPPSSHPPPPPQLPSRAGLLQVSVYSLRTQSWSHL